MSVSTVSTAKATFSIAEVNQSSFTTHDNCVVSCPNATVFGNGTWNWVLIIEGDVCFTIAFDVGLLTVG